ncbi:MAG TPA: hypothetical protein VJB98_02010 [Candidatus Paceibacterota bacterium]
MQEIVESAIESTVAATQLALAIAQVFHMDPETVVIEISHCNY